MADALDGLLAVFLVAALGAWLLAALLVRRGWRRLRRDPRLSRAIGLTRSHALRPGPRRDAARLRLRLDDALAGTRRAVSALAASGAPAGDLPGLCGRLERACAPVRQQLGALEREPDDALAGALLRPAAARAEELLALAGRLRTGAAEQLGLHGRIAGDGLAGEIEGELAALRAGRRAVDTLRRA